LCRCLGRLQHFEIPVSWQDGALRAIEQRICHTDHRQKVVGLSLLKRTIVDVRSADSTYFATTSKNIAATVFLGTPHLGSGFVHKFPTWLRRAVFSQGTIDSDLGARFLVDTNHKFAEACNAMKSTLAIISVIETEPYSLQSFMQFPEPGRRARMASSLRLNRPFVPADTARFKNAAPHVQVPEQLLYAKACHSRLPFFNYEGGDGISATITAHLKKRLNPVGRNKMGMD
jgi:hypothetical protein